MHFVEQLGSSNLVNLHFEVDRAFKTLPGRVLAAIWLLVSMLVVARAFLYLAEARVDKRPKSLAKWVLGQDMTVAEFLAADIDNNDFVSRCCVVGVIALAYGFLLVEVQENKPKEGDIEIEKESVAGVEDVAASDVNVDVVVNANVDVTADIAEIHGVNVDDANTQNHTQDEIEVEREILEVDVDNTCEVNVVIADNVDVLVDGAETNDDVVNVAENQNHSQGDVALEEDDDIEITGVK
ncbi:hypothetical protein Droror1_Dr00024460 [Drosera rotundifolia]